MRKRLISCLLSLVLICSLLPANVLAEELRDEPIPTAEEVLPETEEPKAPMKTEESETPAEPETPLSAPAVQDSGEGTLAGEETAPEAFAAEIVREGKDAKKFQTLRKAVAAAQTGDTIRLLDDCEETVQISMNSKKNTPTQLTFDLNGHAIDGKGEKRCIVGIQANSATDRCTLTVKNGTLKNGAAGKGSSGGAISWPCDLKIEDCTIEKNADKAIAVSFQGEDGLVEISGTDFIGNHEERPAGSGGAVSIAMNGTAEISDCTFTDNSAGSMGGAIYCDHGELNITDCTFEKNEAAYGGAVACMGTRITLEGDSAAMKENTASVMGGAIHIQGQSILNIGDAMLADNEAAWGGAISAYASEVNIHGTLEGNTAARLGGGCYNSASMLNLNGAVICNNRAGTAGDDIFNADAAAKLSLGGTGKQTLDDCGDQIDGWYEDGMPGTAENDDGTTSTVYGPRWDAHSEQNHVKACPAGTVEGALAVKAAHKVIVPMEPDEPDAPFHSKSKTATNLNSRYQSDVTLSLPAQQETLISDVVFVLDKSTSPEKESALRMLETLREQVGADAKVRVGVVTFNTTAAKNGFFDLSTELDKIQTAFDAPQVSGTNLHAGILAGASMLDADTAVQDDHRKYLIVISDGITYMYDEDAKIVPYYWMNDGSPYFSKDPYSWDFKYGQGTTFTAEQWDAWVETTAETLKQETIAPALYENKNTLTAEDGVEVTENLAYTTSVDCGLYYAYQAYRAAAQRYRCYAVAADTGKVNTYPFGPSFMEYLAGGEEVSFDTIRNEIVYLLGAGSCVVDEIGSGTDNKGNAYHFDFVDDAANLALTVGGRTYTVTKAEQVESGAVSTYWFGQPVENGQSGADYPFVLHYYKDGTTLRGERYDECFVWEFHAPVTQFQRVELTYTVRLADPQTAAGTYGAYDGTGESGASALFTNNSAVLYSVDSTGVSGQPERFRRPTVSYTVSGSSGGGGGSGSGKLNTEEHYSYIIGYKDGLLRPYGEISRGEVAAIFFRMLTDQTRNEYWSQTNPFTDVAAEKWCNNAISTLFSMGIIDGYSDGAFRPDGPITRAAFTKMAVNFFDYHVKDYDGRFTDVEGDAWYAGYIQAAAELKLIEGFDDGTFRPDDYITRAQACAIINRTLGRVPDADRMSIRPLVTWPDCDEDAWYYADMMEATNSHDYQWITVGGEKTEKWTKKLPQRDWAALEHTWSTANSAKGGEVVG